MTDLPAATIAAADFYDRHYAGAEPIFLEPGMKLMLGSGERPRHCRFCDKDELTVTFKDEAHALPAAFGNTGLFSNYECDACNHLFGEGIENHLGNWTKPMRTLSRIRGRSRVPNRVGKADGAHEHQMYEGAVMVAYPCTIPASL